VAFRGDGNSPETPPKWSRKSLDNHQPGGDPDACLEPYRFDIEATDSVDGVQSKPQDVGCPARLKYHRLCKV